MVFTKQDKHTFCVGLLVDDASLDLALPSSIFQRIGLSGSVTGTTVVEMVSGKASIGSMTNEKCSKHLSLLYVSSRMRVKNGMDGVVENGTHALHGNPTMTLHLIAKETFSHVLWMQEHDRDPFERSSLKMSLNASLELVTQMVPTMR
ncbi:hypothetical protein TNCV_4823381 [Trichonephila clavipes]|nr:hypothetical protein TNCV_4823381 [Trichonephila clavipes]